MVEVAAVLHIPFASVLFVVVAVLHIPSALLLLMIVVVPALHTPC